MTSTRRAVSLVTLCIANLRLRSFPNVKDSIVGDCESQAGSVQSKQPPPSHVAQLGYPASVRCIGSGRGKPGGSSSSHSPAMAAWCVSAKSSASWRVTHGLNQPHEHFALVPRVMWLTKMRLCSFIGVSRSGGGEDGGLIPFGRACGELSGDGTGRAHDSHHLAAQGRGGGDCLNGAQRQRDGRHADVAATGEQKRDSAGQARQDRHGENVPASLERQTVRVHAQGGVSAVPVGGEAEQWHGSFLSLWGLALILPRNRPRRGGTEADQPRPSRWKVAAFRATVRPRASRYVQPQEHTACQPLR